MFSRFTPCCSIYQYIIPFYGQITYHCSGYIFKVSLYKVRILILTLSYLVQFAYGVSHSKEDHFLKLFSSQIYCFVSILRVPFFSIYSTSNYLQTTKYQALCRLCEFNVKKTNTISAVFIIL